MKRKITDLIIHKSDNRGSACAEILRNHHNSGIDKNFKYIIPVKPNEKSNRHKFRESSTS